MIKKSPLKFIGIGVLVMVAIFAFGYVTMSLWNWLVPDLFSGPVITYWQAVGLLILSRLLLPGGHGGSKSHRHSYPTSEWKKRFRSKMHDECGPNQHFTPVSDLENSAGNEELQ